MRNHSKSNPLVSAMTKKPGPKSLAGKKTSSQNARKSSIFAKGYLPWEDLAQKQLQHEQLCQQWQADDPTSQMFIRMIEQCDLEIERIMYAQRQKIEAAMHSPELRNEFLLRCEIFPTQSKQVPNWYTAEDGHEEKIRALEVFQVFTQAKKVLGMSGTIDDALVKRDYPQLYVYIQTTKPAPEFSQSLHMLYRQDTIQKNLLEFVQSLKLEFHHHLVWAENARRYQSVLDGVRGELMLKAMDADKMMRYATNSQNRVTKALQGLAGMQAMKIEQARAQLELSNFMEAEPMSTRAPDDGEVDEDASEDCLVIHSEGAQDALQELEAHVVLGSFVAPINIEVMASLQNTPMPGIQ